MVPFNPIFLKKKLNKYFFEAGYVIESIEEKRERILMSFTISAILYSVRYRKVFAGYLDIAFPRIPYPKDVELFQQLAKKGKELCQIHLLEADVFNVLSSKLRNNDGSIATTSQKISIIRPNAPTKIETKEMDNWTGQFGLIHSTLKEYLNVFGHFISVAINPHKSGSKTARNVN